MGALSRCESFRCDGTAMALTPIPLLPKPFSGDPIGEAAAGDAVRRGIAAHNRSQPGASTRIARVHLMAEPASIDANEITDKGYVNQRAVLERRADLVQRLFADPPAPDVIVC